ncbi:hypothetical protein HNP84_004122 [Thermocatellispora tengchongensis]|uniref:Glyoxalase-like domain-containing protein n=1 Tax=Thermocatellispora tengchongensis TaxID=1073253 RepID=A0A840PAG4_9ACTN|nr:VOC family protein [Thermocatellispora tengchongensis]MBB5134390.1 hypothetical protein [Thermocatellispora tengchongensis]
MRIDHVTIGARDVGQARELLWDRYGFGLAEGGPLHDGTANWVVPFDTPDVQYLEVVVPRDEDAMAAAGIRDGFMERTAAGPAFLTWAVLVEGIEEAARRVAGLLGEDPGLLRGESVRPGGLRLPWAEAAYTASWRKPARPFFLEYGAWPLRRARVPRDLAAARHRTTPSAISALVVGTGGTAPADLDAWLGGADLPVLTEPDAPCGVREVVVETHGGGRIAVRLP